jgi:[ribosomal protein S5]-alanine N-acetyltransferase
MNRARVSAGEVVLETDRLQLRRWRVSDAALQRQLWGERDFRVPPNRRVTANGHPTLEDIQDRLRREEPDPCLGFLAAERKGSEDVIGYCGLMPNAHGQDGEPEIAYEFLRKFWNQGYATEASWAVLSWAKDSGYRCLWATVREWNTGSRCVMVKLGFVETDRVEPDDTYGNSLFYTKNL